MKVSLLLVLCLMVSLPAFCQLNFLNKLKKGIPQRVVIYGTSLSSGTHGRNWMSVVANELENKYGAGLLSYSLSGKGGQWSNWGVQNLQDSVISKQPDAVFIEFGINDAFLEHKTSVDLARLNLEYMIDRILISNDSCDVVLQIMNMAIGKSASFRPDLEIYYEMYRQVARKKNLVLIDHYENWSMVLKQGETSFRAYVPDGLHPNAQGAKEIIAPEILRVLNIELNKEK